jgi:metal-sulfur cluster biosynthetic enzyme
MSEEIKMDVPELVQGKLVDEQGNKIPLPAEEAIRDAIIPVEDPELNLSVVDLGLIYGIERDEEERDVKITMTLTSMACPVGPQLRAAVHGAVAKLNGVEDVYVDLVFNPPWNPRTMASEDAQLTLGIA